MQQLCNATKRTRSSVSGMPVSLLRTAITAAGKAPMPGFVPLQLPAAATSGSCCCCSCCCRHSATRRMDAWRISLRACAAQGTVRTGITHTMHIWHTHTHTTCAAQEAWPHTSLPTPGPPVAAACISHRRHTPQPCIRQPVCHTLQQWRKRREQQYWDQVVTTVGDGTAREHLVQCCQQQPTTHSGRAVPAYCTGHGALCLLLLLMAVLPLVHKHAQVRAVATVTWHT